MLRTIPALCLTVALGLVQTLRADGLSSAQLTQVTVAKTDLRKVNELITTQDYEEAQDALKAVVSNLQESGLPDSEPQVRELKITIDTYQKRIDVATGKAKPAIELKPPSGKKGKRRMMVMAERPAGPVRFDRDVAPILIGNCLGCHNPKKKSSKLDLSTYASFKEGGKRGPAFEPGSPDESLVVKFLRGIEQPKMPKNGQFLEEDAIERVEDWIKEGASVGKASPTAPLASIIPSEDQVQRERVAKMSDQELTSFHEQLAEAHWPKVTKKPADIASNDTFLVYSSTDTASAEDVLKWADSALAEIRGRIGGARRGRKAAAKRSAEAAGEPVWRGRLTIYVFGDRPGYNEFVRSVEGQADLGAGSGAFQPQGRGASDRHQRPRRRRRAEPPQLDHRDSGRRLHDGNRRRPLAALVQRWLLGRAGAKKDARAKAYKEWKLSVYRKYHDDWNAAASSVLDDSADWDADRDLAFSFVEFLEAQRQPFAAFIRTLNSKGGTADSALKAAFGGSRERLIAGWGDYIKKNYALLH